MSNVHPSDSLIPCLAQSPALPVRFVQAIDTVCGAPVIVKIAWVRMCQRHLGACATHSGPYLLWQPLGVRLSHRSRSRRRLRPLVGHHANVAEWYGSWSGRGQRQGLQ